MKIKLLLLVFAAVLMQSCVVSQKSMEDKETTETVTITKVNLPAWIMKSAIRQSLKAEGMPKEVKRLMKKIDDIDVLVVENANPKIINKYVRKISKTGMQELISINTEGTNMKVYSASGTPDNVIKDFILAVKEEEEYIYVKIKGSFTIEDVAQIINAEANNHNIISMTE